MAWKVKVTRKNVDQMAIIAQALKEQLQDLLTQVQRYPLEVFFEGYRVCFETQDDVRSFLAYLENQVQAVRSAA